MGSNYLIGKFNFPCYLFGSTSNTGFGRFGNGIYFAPNSCKSHAYTGTSIYHYILVCKVALGSSKVLLVDDTTLTSVYPYHSVHGKKGVRLNYDEYVVYNENQALPVAVIVYRVL